MKDNEILFVLNFCIMIEAMDGFYICILQKTTAFAMLWGKMRKELSGETQGA